MKSSPVTVGFSDLNDQNLEVDYKDNDLLIANDIRDIPDIVAVKLTMNVLLFCRKGKLSFKVNGLPIAAATNELVIVQSSALITDLMISPDFECYVACISDRLVKSQLRSHIDVWNNVLYVNHMNIIQLPDEHVSQLQFFYEMGIEFLSKPRAVFHDEVIGGVVHSMLFELCGLLVEQSPGKQTGSKGQADNLFNQFLQLLNQSDIKRHTVEYYASLLCVSAKYLSMVCKSVSGKTALQWINEYTIQEIRYYLGDSTLSIKEVSEKLGFPNTSFFGKYVKQHLGLTPRECRNELQSLTAND